MITITITPRTLILAAFLTLAALSALYATNALGSSSPDSILLGDTDCDGDVDADDALNDLRYVGGLNVGTFPGCPQVGQVAAIPGPPGISGYQVVSLDSDSNSSPSRVVIVTCPQGKVLLGGGAGITGTSDNVSIVRSQPDSLNTTWLTTAIEVASGNPNNWRLTAYGICATVAQ